MARSNYIKQKREEVGLTVTELACRIGKNRATVYRYENGNIENVPSVVIEKIAEVLGTTAMEILGYASDEVVLSDTERRLVLAYRSHPEMQDAVNKLLGIE